LSEPRSNVNPASGVRVYRWTVELHAFDAFSARDLLKQAVEADPKYPMAHAALASAWSSWGNVHDSLGDLAGTVKLHQDAQLIFNELGESLSVEWHACVALWPGTTQ
jgi:Tfp pilus assembly protein PilF